MTIWNMSLTTSPNRPLLTNWPTLHRMPQQPKKLTRARTMNQS